MITVLLSHFLDGLKPYFYVDSHSHESCVASKNEWEESEKRACMRLFVCVYSSVNEKRMNFLFHLNAGTFTYA